MTADEAKQILLRYRSGIPVIEDPELAEALSLAKEDPELNDWLRSHTAWQKEMVRQFRQMPVPDDLRRKILNRSPNRQTWWKSASFVAAAVVLLMGLILFWAPKPNKETLAGFQARMVSFALREYSMDIVTNDVSAIRAFLRVRQAPADFALTPALSSTEAKGGARLAWQNKPVAMICFKLDAKETLYLFVLDAKAIHPNTLPEGTEIKKISRLTTATWQVGGNIYFLAGNAAPEDLQRFIAKRIFIPNGFLIHYMADRPGDIQL
ncbi:MAG: hypothetical protein ACO1QB_12840 [Verrucomicrobiales bacterium]